MMNARGSVNGSRSHTFHAGCNPDGRMEIKEYDLCERGGKEAGVLSTNTGVGHPDMIFS